MGEIKCMFKEISHQEKPSEEVVPVRSERENVFSHTEQLEKEIAHDFDITTMRTLLEDGSVYHGVNQYGWEGICVDEEKIMPHIADIEQWKQKEQELRSAYIEIIPSRSREVNEKMLGDQFKIIQDYYFSLGLVS